jgi:hypothetical protein
MKSLIIAAGLIAVGMTTASAQIVPWDRSLHPYAERHHRVCQDKAFRLYQYERRAASDAFLSRFERANIIALKRDLDLTCGRFRWRG